MSKSKKKTSKKSSDFGIILDTGEQLGVRLRRGEELDEGALNDSLLVLMVTRGIIPGLPLEDALQLCYDKFSGPPADLDVTQLGRSLSLLQDDTMMRQ